MEIVRSENLSTVLMMKKVTEQQSNVCLMLMWMLLNMSYTYLLNVFKVIFVLRKISPKKVWWQSNILFLETYLHSLHSSPHYFDYCVEQLTQ